jgi:cytochrome c oxidase accessory protein FixG
VTTLAAERPGEAAPGIEALDAKPINRKRDRALYAPRQKVYPKLAHGPLRRSKWMVMAVALGIYYGLPWLRWSRGPGLPDQAVLVDPEHGRLFFFPFEIWPQELYFVTGLLVMAALALFLVTSAFGRVWCGYACPQTVWTDLMIAVERLWQGDRNQRMRLDREPWSASKLLKKALTHISFLAIALATGGALVFYFRDAATLAREFAAGSAPAAAYLFLGIFTATTYLLGGIAREQVCIYMCPWPRIQGAMVDRHTLLVSYRPERGEPRGPLRKSQGWHGRGDCIDCKACVAVCPTGIDIRDGSQLECIQCALCVDACNAIMDKVGRPRGLIGYDTVAKQQAKQRGEHEAVRLVRPRTVLYAALIVLVAAAMLAGLLGRSTLQVSVQHDRGVLFVPLSDGGVRNGYTIKIANKLPTPREVLLAVDGPPGARLALLGVEGAGAPRVSIGADTLRELRAFVTVPRESLAALTPPQTPFAFLVTDAAAESTVRRATSFQSPP